MANPTKSTQNQHLNTDWQSGFGQSQFTEANTLFQDGNVWVSFDQFVNGSAHYPIKRIKSAAIGKGPIFTLGSVAIFIAGLVAVPFQLYVGLAAIAGTMMFWVARKPSYRLMLKIGEKKVMAMESGDVKYLKTILQAIVDASKMRQAGNA